MRALIPFLALPLLVAAGPARADGFASTAALDRAVAQFVGAPIGALGGARSAIDSRLRLATCADPTINWRSAAHDAVTVTCAEPAWRVFVAINKAAPASGGAAAATAAAAPAVKADPVIKRGDLVQIEAGTDGFTISTDGVAMADAPPGGRFAVRMEGAKQPIQAVAIAAGRATIPGW